jgi:DNA polymerase
LLRFVIADFETASDANLKRTGAWVYAEHPTTEVLTFWWGDEQCRQCWHPGDDKTSLMAMATDDNLTVIAFNAAFEKAIWRTIMVPDFGFPDILNKRWHDVQAVAAMKVLPQDLDRCIQTLRLPVLKDKAGSKATIALSRTRKDGSYDRSEEAIKATDRYCEQDILSEAGLHTRLGWLPQGERSVWLLNQRINERGLKLDIPYIIAAQLVVDRATEPLAKEFKDLTGGLDFTQMAKIKEWCAGQGVYLADMTKERLASMLGEDIDATEETEDGDGDLGMANVSLPDSVRRALGIRQLIGSASVKKLARMRECVCSDGRARGLLQYHGTGPGRSAGRLFQPHNFPRGTTKIDGKAPDPDALVDAIMTGDPEYVEILFGPAVEAVVSGLRHAIVPDIGRVLLSGDYAGIQARTVLAVAGQHDKTALMASGVDVYCDMASVIYKRPITKDDAAERHDGKGGVLGCGFQIGWAEFQRKFAPTRSDDFCKEVVRIYRKEWAPKVPYVWYGLQDAAVAAVWEKKPQAAYGVEYRLEDGWLTARLPSGRKIWYFNPTPVRRPMPWDEDDIRPAFTYQAMKMGRLQTIDAFGGQLTENVVMGIERDLMTNAMFKCEKNGFPICLEIHDQIVAEPLRADADVAAFKQLMEDVEPWVKAIQIPVSVDVAEPMTRFRK